LVTGRSLLRFGASSLHRVARPETPDPPVPIVTHEIVKSVMVRTAVHQTQGENL
jgi:hypothetical protein